MNQKLHFCEVFGKKKIELCYKPHKVLTVSLLHFRTCYSLRAMTACLKINAVPFRCVSLMYFNRQCSNFTASTHYRMELLGLEKDMICVRGIEGSKVIVK